jgi:hypothetical protein
MIRPTRIKAAFHITTPAFLIVSIRRLRFLEVPRDPGGGKVPFTEEQLERMPARSPLWNIAGS